MENLTAEQAFEWELYNSIEPVGEVRGDTRIGILTSTLYNMISSFGGKKGKRVISKPFDFMPFQQLDKPKEVKQVQSVDHMKQILFMINDVANPKKKKVDVSLTRPPKSLREKNV